MKNYFISAIYIALNLYYSNSYASDLLEFKKSLDKKVVEQFKQKIPKYIKICVDARAHLEDLDDENRFPKRKVLKIVSRLMEMITVPPSSSIDIDDKFYSSALEELKKIKKYDPQKILQAFLKIDPSILTTPVKLAQEGHTYPTAYFKYHSRSLASLLSGSKDDSLLVSLIEGLNPAGTDLHHISQLDVLEIIQELPSSIHTTHSKTLHKRKTPTVVRNEEMPALELEMESSKKELYDHFSFNTLKSRANKIQGLGYLIKILHSLEETSYLSMKKVRDDDISSLATSPSKKARIFREAREKRARQETPTKKNLFSSFDSDGKTGEIEDIKEDKDEAYRPTIKSLKLPPRKTLHRRAKIKDSSALKV